MGKISTSEADRLARLDTFVIASVITILLTRAYLALTGYPQIGGTNLHIAHMLYGGAILVPAFLFLLLAKKPNKLIAATIGGIGFGLFIDEIGKFVTKNNDYFFKPSVGLMYISFLLIWFIARAILVRADKLPFLSPAEWPNNIIARILIIFWSFVQVLLGLAVSINLVFGKTGDTTWKVITPNIAALITVMYSLFILFGLWQYCLRDKLNSARTIRAAMLFGVLLVYPFYFLSTPEVASIFIAPTILVLIGLSEVSVTDLIKRLLDKPINV